ncbi:CG3587 [Drosophila busckii]|uniref:Protein KTI12 homolog n=1 Tax=Drosophila busckii TaxID=30019 RepID=A0A0M4ETJ1_DROBS|nr:protein KTI12 homolog [Drosophila busckii]ALC49852.1 CG3587 [Drosophila busckii]
MPIVVITGLPASGKTTRAEQLRDYIQSKGIKVHLISENETVPKALYEKNACFEDSQKEKVVRGDLKSEASRHLNQEDLVILDAGNYIKGFRYELFCQTKSARTTQCTLFCCISQEKAWEFNIKRSGSDLLGEQTKPNNSHVPYSREVFDSLCMRYEEPQSNNRWDSPLVVALPEDNLNMEDIYMALYETKSLVPNLSTQNPPLGATNYLFEFDNVMQDIISEILGAVKIGAFGQLRIKGSSTTVKVTTSMTPMLLNRLRQKFIRSTCRPSQTTQTPLPQVPQLFVQFINANMTGC